ncbi:MAG: L,D-transpeptidase [Anaerolineae bacterium]|nr:L,D-transpeptidase [Thermoflexales bacterium]MDW8406280.1 L,D-transpeptidase [Anaerolineae bacterium]
MLVAWLFKTLPALTLAACVALGATPPVAQAAPLAQTSSSAGASQEDDPLFNKVYAHVNTAGGAVPVFRTPEEAVHNGSPVRELKGYEWITVLNTVEIDGVRVSQINPDEWILADKLTLTRPSRFQGQRFDQMPDRPFAWVLSEFQPTLEPGGNTNAAAPVYRRYQVVQIYEKAVVGSTIWYRIGEQQWTRQQRLGLVTLRQPPFQIRSLRERVHGKWIFVNLYEQTLAAYEGERLVFASLVSSGLPKWETVKGVFRIQYKNRLQPMYNAAGDPDLGEYYLEEVPFNMFFHGDYALHGAYWHDGFGSKKSRGCVNLSIRDARWLFDWSDPKPSQWGYAQAGPDNPGTWVWVW